MIHPKEVRLGNYFKDELTGEWLLVDEITKSDNGNHVIGFYVVNRKKYPLPAGWKAVPIELSPEILEKCGFENEDDGFGWCDKAAKLWLTVKFIDDILWLGEEDDNFIFTSYVELKYLNTFQNAYFALTGTELEISL